jgi:hypothetical protein
MRKNIERAIQGSMEQGLLTKPLALEDIYYRTTLNTWAGAKSSSHRAIANRFSPVRIARFGRRHGPRLGVTADRLFLGAERRRRGTVDNPPFDHGCQTVGYLRGELKVLLDQQDRDAIVAEDRITRASSRATCEIMCREK